MPSFTLKKLIFVFISQKNAKIETIECGYGWGEVFTFVFALVFQILHVFAFLFVFQFLNVFVFLSKG